MLKRTIIALLLTGLSLSADTHAEIYRLNNGLEVVLIENPALPMVGMNMVIKTGSAYETFATSGMSHMLEHLLFNGTTRRDQRELYDDVDRIGGYNNANTSTYYTNFMMVVPAAQCVAGMDIQADMLFHSTLPEDKFAKEQGIVLEEIAQSLSKPSTQIEHDLNAELYAGHALALPTLGTYATIGNMTRDDVYAYYRNHYRPNNMILSVIGAFEADTLLPHIREIYGSAVPADVQRPADTHLATGFQLPAERTATPSVKTRFYRGENPVVHLIYSLPAGEMSRSLLLMEEALRISKPGLVEQLRNNYPDEFRDLSLDLYTAPAGKFLVAEIALEPVADVEAIRQAVARVLSGLRLRLSEESIRALATQRKTRYLQNLEKPHMFGIYYAGLLAEKGIDASLDYLQTDDFATAADWLKRFRLKDQPRVLIHLPAGESDTMAAGEVNTELLREGPGQVLIARQNTASELLAVHLLFKHKSYYESRYGKDAAVILHDCFGQRMDEPAKRAASQAFGFTFTVNDNPFIPMDDIYLHPDFGYIRAEGLSGDLTEALDFLFEQLDTFVPTEAEYQRAVNSLTRGMHTMNRNQAGEAFNELVDSVLYQPVLYPESDSLVSYENLLTFSEAYFNPQNRVISIVSPQAPEQLAQLVPAGTENLEIPAIEAWTERLNNFETSQRIERQAGGERIYLFWGYVKDVDPADQAALKALSLVLSDRIVFDVRERQGMAYRMGAGISQAGDRALFYIRLGTRPQNVDPLLPQIPNFFNRRMVRDLTDEELEKSINMYLGRMMFRRLSSINQAYYLGTSQYFKGDMLADEAALDALSKVTLEEVQQAARTYLVPEKRIQIILR